MTQLTGNVLRTWLTFSHGSLKVINKYSSSNVNITFVQSYFVLNNVLNWLDGNIIYTLFVGFLNIIIQIGETRFVSESSVES